MSKGQTGIEKFLARIENNFRNDLIESKIRKGF